MTDTTKLKICLYVTGASAVILTLLAFKYLIPCL